MKKDEKKKRENIVEDIDIGRFSELATTDRKYVNGLYLQESKNEILEDYTGNFELIGSMLFGEIEQKHILDSKMLMISKVILMR